MYNSNKEKSAKVTLNHNVWVGFNKVVKCFHYLISAFGPFKVCVTFFIWLLKTYRTKHYNTKSILIIKTKTGININQDCQTSRIYSLFRKMNQWPGTNIFDSEAYPESFNTETQSCSGAQRLPPLHVPGFQHSLLVSFMGCWSLWVHSYHLLVHVFTRLRPFSGNEQFFLKVRAVKDSASMSLSLLWLQHINHIKGLLLEKNKTKVWQMQLN